MVRDHRARERLGRLGARRRAGRRVVVDEAGREQFVDHIEVAGGDPREVTDCDFLLVHCHFASVEPTAMATSLGSNDELQRINGSERDVHRPAAA
jgi:hypothetical protein